MNARWLGLVLFLAASAVRADWEWSAPLTVGADPAGRAFAHLGSAGRKNIAVSDGWVAVVWEDNRDGTSRCYAALKAPDREAFSEVRQISGAEEAFEPAVVGLAGGRFALSWEEAGRAHARMLDAKGMGQPLSLSNAEASQVSLAFSREAGLFAAWSQKDGAFWRVELARLVPVAEGLRISAAFPVERGKLRGGQSYPSVVAIGAKQVVVAWEDRRAGHTRILSAASGDGGRHFSPPANVNEIIWRGRSVGYGHGTGVMRVALARFGARGVAAVWADKRDFQSGYDVYAAFAQAPGFKFGVNEKVQDPFGDNIAQWHPAVAANGKGQVAVVWDDNRDDSPDIWLSWRDAKGWSDNLAVPGAFGPGVQSDPSLTMDEAGNLYMAWVEKADLDSPSRIRYVFGRLAQP